MHPPSEKSPLLTRIGIPATNAIPFPQIVTPASTHHSSCSYPCSSESPRSPLSPPASILIESRHYLPRPATSSSSRRDSSWLPPLPEGFTLAAFIQASFSGAASLLGWDMVTGCILYAPNESLHVFRDIFRNPTPSSKSLGMICSACSFYGILISTILTILSSLVYFRSQQRSKPSMLSGLGSGGPSFKVNFAAFVMTPTACLLASMFTALILLADASANIGTVCHLGSALCASVGIIVALLA